jgi:hypothetical protein
MRFYDTFEDYLDAVKDEISHKDALTEFTIWNVDVGTDATSEYLTKEEWDKLFKFIRDNNYTFGKMSIYGEVDLNDLTGMGVLSDITEFKSFYINKSVEEDLTVDFPDMPNITSLDIPNGYDELYQHFPNLTDLDINNSINSVNARIIIKNCKNIKNIKGKFIRTDSFYAPFFEEAFIEELSDYSSGSGNGLIDGRFTLSYVNGSGTQTNYLKDKLPALNEGNAKYSSTYKDCDYYIVVSAERDAYVGYYDTMYSRGYSSDFYIQIFDVKNEVKYKKVYLATIDPPKSISYDSRLPPARVYGDTPDDKIIEFIKEAINQ